MTNRPPDRVASRRRMSESLMMSAAQLDLAAQDVADLIAFLRSKLTGDRSSRADLDVQPRRCVSQTV
jgi:hypothetical protein